MCLRSPQNLEFGHFTLLFCRGLRGRNVPKFILHVRGLCFSHFSRCRCRRHSSCLNSLYIKPGKSVSSDLQLCTQRWLKKTRRTSRCLKDAMLIEQLVFHLHCDQLCIFQVFGITSEIIDNSWRNSKQNFTRFHDNLDRISKPPSRK